ncbi:MAG: hypothetical protein GXO65_07500 [Euryarchaeota archaeon]|nr:hypothetical protein [Euryarchaeota archaeon]
MGTDYKDFVDFLLENHPGMKKVVEVGIGPDLDAFRELKRRFAGTVLATDVNPSSPEVIKDDVTSPDIAIYQGADLIYSIRPPPELFAPLEELARRVGARLVIRPLSTDDYGDRRPVNHGRAVILQLL